MLIRPCAACTPPTLLKIKLFDILHFWLQIRASFIHKCLSPTVFPGKSNPDPLILWRSIHICLDPNRTTPTVLPGRSNPSYQPYCLYREIKPYSHWLCLPWDGPLLLASLPVEPPLAGFWPCGLIQKSRQPMLQALSMWRVNQL